MRKSISLFNTFLPIVRAQGCRSSAAFSNTGSRHLEKNRNFNNFQRMESSATELANSENADYVEGIVCKEEEIGENEMKTVDLKDGKVLLVKQKGKLTAVGAKCTHYGALLSTGALGDGRVRCPWHGASFNTCTGDIEDFPGLDSLPCYQVKIENGNVIVKAKRTELQTNKRIKSMSKRLSTNQETIVALGGGPAGGTCVENLRQEGFTGRIVLISKENALPYDRIRITKVMNSDLSQLQFRSDDFYKQNDIEVMKGVSATSIDTDSNLVSLSNGEKIKYTKLFIGTGCRAVKTDVMGADLKNVEVLRNISDGSYVHEQLTPEKEVVILGSSYIALEAAAYCVSKVKKVSVVMRGDVPFKPVLGARIGAAFKTFFEDKGINFVTNSGIKRCVDNGNGVVNSVELTNGEILKADICIMGVGAKLNTEFVKGSGINMKEDGSIEVDEFLQTNIPNIFAGGDLAYAPVWSHGNEKSVIGHYSLAQFHGKIAALNLLNKKMPLKAVPFFWTMFLGKGIRYAGHGKFQDILYSGDVEALKFIAYYLDEDEIVAMSSSGMDPYVAKYAEILTQGRKIYRKDLTGENLLDWAK